MKSFNYLFTIYILMCFACAKNISKQKVEHTTSKTELESVIPQSTYNTLLNASEIKLFKIEKALIEGTTDEYSNKSIFIKDLTPEEVDECKKLLLENSSYNWNLYTEDPEQFNPDLQFVLLNNNNRVNMLIDTNDKLLSYIDLDGQKVLPISNSFFNILTSISQ